MLSLRTDHDIAQLPTSVPDFGGLLGKNVSRTDPDFKTTITRITDASDNHNQSLTTACSGQSPIWNHDDTMIIISTPGGSKLLYQFYPLTATAKILPYKYKTELAFSRTTPATLYELDGTVIRKLTFKRVNTVWTYQTGVDVCDFANILPPTFVRKWTGTFQVTSDDSMFVVAFSEGVQNSAFHSCVWRKGYGKGKGYRMLNTQTGEVTGDWGELGAARIVSDDTHVPFTMHESSVLPHPMYATIGPWAKQGDAPLIWTVATLDLVDRVVSGHGAEGYLHFYCGGPGGGQIAEVAYADPSQKRLIVPPDELPGAYGQKYTGDRHYGFGHVDPLDDAVFWCSSQTDVSPFTSCWQNEVYGYHAQTGDTFRVCHTFNTGLSKEFITANAIAVASQRGKYIAFCSDMLGTLGSTTGAAQGTPGVDARGDVFVVRIA